VKSNDNLITNNTISDNQYGLYIDAMHRFAIDNIIRFNTFEDNELGIKIESEKGNEEALGTRNKVYLNNFIDNTIQALDDGYDNRWDTGNIGNYWTDYFGVDCGGMYYPWDMNGKHMLANDGIGDTIVPHMIDEDSGDYYPIIRLSGWIPIADAGPDQNVTIGQIVHFSGIGSWDLDGWIVNYTWDFGGGNLRYGMNVTFTYLSNGNFSATLTVTDNDGFIGSDTCNITVSSQNVPPVADVNGPYSGFEGSSITFDASGSYDLDGDVLNYRWDMDGNGTWDTGWLLSPTIIRTWGDDYSGTVIVEVTDGVLTDSASTTVTVLNVPPKVSAGNNETISEGDPLSFTGNFTDPGWLDSHTILWNFGDGNSQSGTITPDHEYGDNGIFSVTLTVTDDDGGTGSNTIFITVNNVAPQLESITAPGGNEGAVITYVSSANDPGSDDLTFTWNWGDGTSDTQVIRYNDGSGPDPYPSPGGTYPFGATISVDHIFGDNGVYSISLMVVDDDGGIFTYSTNITVENVAPSLNSILAPGGNEGSSIDFQATGSDLGSDDLKFTWSWGDGTSDTVLYHYNDGMGPDPYPSPWGTYPFSAINNPSHTYGDNGHYTITLTIEDDDGIEYEFSVNTVIDNVAPTIGDSAPPGGDEGAMLPYLSTSTDPGTDDLTFTWDWGDGTSDTVTIHYNDGTGPDPYPSPWGTYPFTTTDSVSHTYGDNGVYTLTLTVEDDDGGLVSFSIDITINNVAPTMDSVTSPNGDEGSVLSYLSSASDPGSDDLIFTWMWGDGTMDTTTIYYNDGADPDSYPSPWGTFPFSAMNTVEHVYGDNGVYSITLEIEDDDGGKISYTTNVTIDNVAPTITPFGPLSIGEGSLLSIMANADDPGSDDLTFTWEFELGPTITNVHYNDAMGADPYPSPWGNFPCSVEDSVDHMYGDNGIYAVYLTVEDDDGGITAYETYVIVDNVAPAIEKAEAFVLVNFTLRIAGEKWHDVEMHILAGGSEINAGEVIRYPGNPDEQTLTLYNVKCDVTKHLEVKIVYTPYDDPVNGRINGATPVWVTMDFEDGEDIRLHHTCNVKHPDTWEWTIGVNQYLVGHNITFEADSSDPGSDDLTFSWDWGDGSSLVETLCCNDGINPEPTYDPGINDIRSPWGMCPFTASDMKKHFYVAGGNYSVSLKVTDDDGGTAVIVITVILV
jgi:PKD repeat protein